MCHPYVIETEGEERAAARAGGRFYFSSPPIFSELPREGASRHASRRALLFFNPNSFVSRHRSRRTPTSFHRPFCDRPSELRTPHAPTHNPPTSFRATTSNSLDDARPRAPPSPTFPLSTQLQPDMPNTFSSHLISAPPRRRRSSSRKTPRSLSPASASHSKIPVRSGNPSSTITAPAPASQCLRK